jgi:hypothetical protein
MTKIHCRLTPTQSLGERLPTFCRFEDSDALRFTAGYAHPTLRA